MSLIIVVTVNCENCGISERTADKSTAARRREGWHQCQRKGQRVDYCPRCGCAICGSLPKGQPGDGRHPGWGLNVLDVEHTGNEYCALCPGTCSRPSLLVTENGNDGASWPCPGCGSEPPHTLFRDSTRVECACGDSWDRDQSHRDHASKAKSRGMTDE